MVSDIRDMRGGGDVLLYHQRGMGAGSVHNGRDVGGGMV